MGKALRGVKEILRYIKETHRVSISRCTLLRRVASRRVNHFPAEKKIVGAYVYLIASPRDVDAWVRKWYEVARVTQIEPTSPTAAAL